MKLAIAPNGVVIRIGSKLVVCMITAIFQNLSLSSPSSIRASIAGRTEKAVVAVIAPLGIQHIATNNASLGQ